MDLKLRKISRLHEPIPMSQDHVVARLKQRLKAAKDMGFQVRVEALGDEQSGWCQLGKHRILFVDLALNAAEQLNQVNDALEDYAVVTQSQLTKRAA